MANHKERKSPVAEFCSNWLPLIVIGVAVILLVVLLVRPQNQEIEIPMGETETSYSFIGEDGQEYVLTEVESSEWEEVEE